MDKIISDSIVELDFTFPTLECFYNYMHEYKREFNTGYYKIKNITYEKCENCIFPDKVIMTQIIDAKYIPPCRRNYTKEEWDEYVKNFQNEEEYNA